MIYLQHEPSVDAPKRNRQQPLSRNLCYAAVLPPTPASSYLPRIFYRCAASEARSPSRSLTDHRVADAHGLDIRETGCNM